MTRILLLVGLAATLLGGVASAAVVQVEGLILRADGGFQPRALPRHRFAPIDFQGHFDIGARGGGKPPALQQVVLGFDRDGHLDVAGLPTCPPDRIALSTTQAARRACAGAIVGTGTVEATVSVAGGNVRGSAPLTVFNGPRVDGDPTVVLHTHTVLPERETYTILAPIERRQGEFGYFVRIDVPPISGGDGSITHVDVAVSRRYRKGGRDRSYVSARCSDSVLKTHGRFTFQTGTIIDGSVEKFCRTL